ncbi:MAG TPA: HepT-like ribonuclease domain-containing protein, partial [Micropepsaceae bacterium]|nr:HepT-like ribonuclease domain-containing protein [Micropepsaceae bacterium]
MPSDKASRSPVQHIEDILDNIDLALEFARGYDFSTFVGDRRTFYAVTRALEIISESSRRLPGELKARFPDIDWRGIAAAGNIYRHNYDDVDE